MIQVNLFDNNFYHTKDLLGFFTCSDVEKPTELEYVDRQMNYDGITLFSDHFIFHPVVDAVKSRLKVAWLFEPRVIFDGFYEGILNFEHKFDYILTYDEELLKRPKYLKYIVGQSRVSDHDAKMNHPKNKRVSLIASNKMISYGHRFRHEVTQALAVKHNIDLWGSGYKRFDSKLDPLKDYQYSIAIMNCRTNNFFTEVLLDCFRLGTIPIFWGCPNIGEYFNTDGMILFETIEELDEILTNLDNIPVSREAMEENFVKCLEYLSTDDYIARILNKL